MDDELYDRLREWRAIVAAAQKVPAYVVFTDATLTALAERLPGSPEQLTQIAGIGPRKLGLYGESVLALIAGAEVADVAGPPVGETSATSSENALPSPGARA
jgi:DNA helicase-2/ATP-dependent DNA helicase PcrA